MPGGELERSPSCDRPPVCPGAAGSVFPSASGSRSRGRPPGSSGCGDVASSLCVFSYRGRHSCVSRLSCHGRPCSERGPRVCINCSARGSGGGHALSGPIRRRYHRRITAERRTNRRRRRTTERLPPRVDARRERAPSREWGVGERLD